MATGIASFDLSNPATTGIKINGTLGGSTLPVQGSGYTPQSTATSTNQFNGGTVLPIATNSPSTKTTTTPVNATSGGAAPGSSDFISAKNNALHSITDIIGTNAGDFGGSIQDYLDSRATQQKGINTDATQNELAREQGQQGILDMVGNGIKSGGVTLGNANAGSSSAAEALARAYGTIGRQQASSVGNQFAQGENKVQNEQDALTAADTTEARHVSQSKTDTINSIVNTARSQLAYLNQYAASASLPDRVDIEGQIAQVKQQALDALTKYDGTLSSGVGTQTPQTADQTRAAAQGLLTAGTAPDSQFDYTTDVPTQLQGSGDFASSLPIFLAPKKSTT